MTDLEKILIVRFSSIGDIVLASPLIRCLRKKFPHAQIDFLVKSQFSELVKYNPHLSSVIELKSSERDELRSLKKQIREQRYDAILDIHNSNRSRYLRLFCGAKHIRVVNKRAFVRFMLVKFKQHWYPKNIPSIAERYLETVKMFGVEDDGEHLEIFIPDEQSSAVTGLLSKYHLDKYEHVVGIVPVAKHFTKRWLP